MEMSDKAEHRRKRVRKGTKSCWECKRRKIKCIYHESSSDPSICVGCLDKGTTCLSQEFVDHQEPRDAGNSSQLDQRMGRLETLLEKLTATVEQAAHESQASYIPGYRALTPSSASATIYDQQAPSMSFDNEGLGQRAEANTSMQLPLSISLSSSSMFAVSAGKGCSILNGKTEKLRRQLAAMLPCQEDVDYLWDLSPGWWLIRRHIMPHLLRAPESDTFKVFDVSAVSVSHPLAIARLLLCVAICIQQAPPNIDMRKLQIKVSLREMMENIITCVTKTVTLDDEQLGSMEGIECLALLAVYEINSGNLRRSWLAFRRAINIAQLMGLHRMSLKTAQEAPDVMETRRQYTWFQIMQGERYLSLVLGIPSATSSAPVPFDDKAPWLTTEQLFHKRLCYISGLVLARNQGDPTHAFSTTQEIDEKLDSLANKMPQSWWEVPIKAIDSRTDEAASQYERTMCQIWHFELVTLVHLPFMLRKATDRRHEYSRISCLSASRGLIERWMFLRKIPSMTLFSNLIDFQAFTATTTLLLGLLGPAYTTTDPAVLKERYEDLQLVDRVVQIFEELAQKYPCADAHFSNQSISAIRALQGVLRNGNSPGNLQLAIPHFGTISIARGGVVHSLEGERIMGATPRSDVEINPSVLAGSFNSTPSTTSAEPTWTSMSAPMNQEYQSVNGYGEGTNGVDEWMNNAVLQFTSSQLPTFEAQDMESTAEWPFQESDVMFFDSLLNTDVEGNWNF